MKKIDLSGKWEVTSSGGLHFQGSVPGCVHTDLYDMEKIYFEDHARDCAELEDQNFTYETVFSLGEDDDRSSAALVFEGLDTYAEIFLNGEKIGDAEDMFLTYRFEVSRLLRVGENTLRVAFRSAVKEVDLLPKRNAAFTCERLYTRRIQCTYGWDWVDRFVTTGIFRPVTLELGGKMALENYALFTENLDSFGAEIRITENFKNFTQGGVVKTELLDGERVILTTEHFVKEPSLTQHLHVECPKLWYPVPYGAQPLYTVRITVGEQVTEEKFGIRTIKILEVQDVPGSEEDKISKALKETPSGKCFDLGDVSSSFALIVNGVRVYCTGANWVPCEPFPSAETPEKITRLLETAVTGGVNVLRVWGGGIFECDHFYRECTRLGILVTQDFLMACGTYPEEDEHFCSLIEKEAEEAALRLRNHTCLAYWSGDNENACNGWDTLENYPGRTAGRAAIAPVLDRLDPGRRFFFSSPYGGKKYASKTFGTTHNTANLGFTFDYISKADLSDYLDYFDTMTARFVAEEPSLGATYDSSMLRFLAPEHLHDQRLELFHTKPNPSLPKELYDYATDFSEKLFGKFKDANDRAFKNRYLQYEWVRFTMEIARKNLWYNSGMIYWMYNDCWPSAMGWSLVDYYEMRKGGSYAMEKYGAPCTVTLDLAKVTLSNILPEEKHGTLRLFALESGKVTPLNTREVTLPSGKTEIPHSYEITDRKILLAELTVSGNTVRTFRKLGAPRLRPALGVTVTENGTTLTVKAGAEYVHAVEIDCGKNLSENYFSLYPGEEKTLSIKSAMQKPAITAYTFEV